MTTRTKPSHNVYVVQGDGEGSRWIKIGAAWSNADGKGFSLKLDVAPILGRVVLREVKSVTGVGGEQ